MLKKVKKHIPVPIKQFIKDLLIPSQKDWAGKIRDTYKRDKKIIKRYGEKKINKKIFFYASSPTSEYLCLQNMLATALELRGCIVKGFICDGFLPTCNHADVRHPNLDCNHCIKKTSRFQRAFGIKFYRTSKFLSKEDFIKARRLVDSKSVSELLGMEFLGIPIGQLLLRDLPRYFYSVVDDDLISRNIKTIKDMSVSSILYVLLASRILKKFNPDILILFNGKTIAHSGIYHLFRKNQKEIITWEEHTFVTINSGYIFNRNCIANELHLENVWQQVSKEELVLDQKGKIDDFFERLKKGELLVHLKYYTNPIENIENIRTLLGLKENKKTILALTNCVWDTGGFGTDIGFKDMMDWVFSCVDYAMNNSDIVMIIRAHPGEKKLPAEFASLTFVHDEIRKKYKSLPENLKLIDADSEISSYKLAEISDIIMAYASTIGFELALRGRKVLVAGNPHYRNKGFTVDIQSKEHMFELFQYHTVDGYITEFQRQLAYRYAYLWLYRHVISLPYLQFTSDRLPRPYYKIESFKDFIPGSNSVIDKLCDKILNHKEFIDF
jgi:hypothetical protein